jgi:plastocyanin
MRRTVFITVCALLAIPLVGAPARAGAFCPEGFSVGDGDRVDMGKSCFLPTVLHVEEGAEVTFVNNDPEPHTVGGAAGSFGEAHKEIPPGGEIGFRFDEEGVFPYFCVLHPGMTGAIVVGDGLGTATPSGDVVLERVSAAERPNPEAEAQEASPMATVAGGLAAAGLGFAGGFAVRRRRIAG